MVLNINYLEIVLIINYCEIVFMNANLKLYLKILKYETT